MPECLIIVLSCSVACRLCNRRCHQFAELPFDTWLHLISNLPPSPLLCLTSCLSRRLHLLHPKQPFAFACIDTWTFASLCIKYEKLMMTFKAFCSAVENCFCTLVTFPHHPTSPHQERKKEMKTKIVLLCCFFSYDLKKRKTTLYSCIYE